MSQIICKGPSFGIHVTSKNGKILNILFIIIISRFYRIRNRTEMKNLRHGSLHRIVLNMYVKFDYGKQLLIEISYTSQKMMFNFLTSNSFFLWLFINTILCLCKLWDTMGIQLRRECCETVPHHKSLSLKRSMKTNKTKMSYSFSSRCTSLGCANFR